LALTPGTRLGVYEITAPIGEGGMGQVYRATDTTLGRQVAIKILPQAFAADADRMARFEREAKTLASLNHSHIAAIYGFEKSGGAHALVMELVEGDDLSQRIARGAIPLDEALPIAKQIAAALEAAHEQGIIHRDLKPANIKVRADGTVKVLDFGLAKALEAATTSNPNATRSPTITTPAMTQAGVILGTAAYMAPEQARGKVVDKRADIWAFGAVLFEMLTGKKPFPGDDISLVLARVIERDPDWSALPPTLPSAIAVCVRRCLMKDLRQRIRDFGDVSLALDGAFESSVQSIPAPAAAPGRRLAWTAFCLAALAAGLLAVPAWRHLHETPPRTAATTFTISPPTGTFFKEVAISPDGARVVFAVGDRTGKRTLWNRRLESLALEPLVGTEGAARPFWSPDSRFIGYYVGPRLFKFDLERGSAQFMANVGETVGTTWLDDGSIVFAENLGGLHLLPPGSTEARPLTTLDAARKESRHYWPFKVPNSRHLLFVVTSSLPDVQGAWVTPVDRSSERRRILGELAMPQFSGGHLFFVRGDTLMAQLFDPDRSALGGVAMPVLDHVDHFANTGYGAFSTAVNGTIVALPRPRPWRLTWFDRSGKTLGAFGNPGRYQTITLSPDDTRVASDAASDITEGYKLFVLDPERDTTTQLTLGESTGNFGTWSPDGRQLAFGSNRDGVYNIYLKSSSGVGQETVLLKSDQNKFVMDWSPDGRFLLYGQRQPGSNRADLWTLPVTGDRTPTIYLRGSGDQRDACFSPDGRWVAYRSDESSRAEVYVQSFPAGADKAQVSVNGGIRPVWRRDGTELYYLTQSGTLMAVPMKLGSSVRPGVPVPLFQTWNTSALNGYAVSRDGRFVFLAPESDNVEQPAKIILNWR
jgi:Tol biopolymer transport system component